jgi:hypothetical protein
MTAATAVSPTLRVLLRGIVDYAGLFPPASLSMARAITEYAAHKESPESWVLGRFVLPAARLDEFETAATPALPREAAQSWALSALLASDVEEDIERIERFNAQHRDVRTGAVLVDTVELKAHAPRDITRAGELLDRRFDTYIEIPAMNGAAIEDLIAATSQTLAKAKIRTGGVTTEAFPSSAQVARFISACVRSQVAFKATAGLHHPLRDEYALTYAADAPRGVMFGFLNMLLATALVRDGADPSTVVEALEERDRLAIAFGVDGVEWRGHSLPLPLLERARDSLVAFGSCSFREPVADLRAMHLL